MNVALIVIIWLTNFGISIWNAYAVGLAWVETKHNGGWPRFMAWMGAIQSACGFSWCYLIALSFVAHGLGWLEIEDIALALKLGYVLVIPGILFSGTGIMLDSWARAYRQRRLRDIGTAAWNTFAQLHNTFNAIKDYDDAFGSVVDSFSKNSKSDSKGVGLLLVLALVLLAILSGIITTSVIINRVAGSQPLRPKSESQIPDSEGYERIPPQ